MEGPVPSDPAVLDEEGDDDVPLKVVQERARAVSGRNGGDVAGLAQAPRTRPQDVDLFGDMSGPAMARPSTTEPAISRPGPPKAPAAPPKQTRPGESLLGLDFFGGSQSAPPARPSSTGPTTTAGVPGRTDLKQSILSLYASKPAAPPPQPAATSNMNAFGGMQSPSTAQSNAQALGGLGDAFGSLSFSSPPQQPAAQSSPFSGLTSPTGHARQPSTTKSALSGGSFFDAKPTPPPKQSFSPPQPKPSARKESFGNDFGDFSTAAPSSFAAKSPPQAAASSGMGDLFALNSAPAPQPPPKPTAPTATYKSPPPISAAGFANTSSSAFNLSQPAQPPKAAPAPPASSMSNFSSLSNMDAWGSNDAWATPADSTPQPPPSQPSTTQPAFAAKPTPAPAASMQSPFDSNGWGDPEPAAPTHKPTPAAASTSTSSYGNGNGSGFGQSSAGGFSVQADEEFGGWSHASPVATTPGPAKSGGGGGAGSDDLFGNVWG